MLALRARSVQQPAHSRHVPPVPLGHLLRHRCHGVSSVRAAGRLATHMGTADSDVGSTSPYGIDCEDGVVGAVDTNPYCDPNPNPNPNPEP